MTNKKILIVTLSVTVIHFLLVSVVGNYIDSQIGNQMGQIVSDGLIMSFEENSQDPEEGTNVIYQGMKTKSEDIIAKWQVPLLLLSLPTKSLMAPLLEKSRRVRVNRLIAKEISKDQFLVRGRITDLVANFVNSISLALLVYIILRLSKQYKREI